MAKTVKSNKRAKKVLSRALTIVNKTTLNDDFRVINLESLKDERDETSQDAKSNALTLINVADDAQDNAQDDATSQDDCHATYDDVQAYSVKLKSAFVERCRYEREKNAENDALQAKMRNMQSNTAHDKIAFIMLSCNVDANLINRQERINARFNEKAFVKVVNIARAIAKAESLNIYTRAILASVRSFEQNEMMLTQRETKDACTSSSRLATTVRNSALIRVNRVYDASTCSTQASSSNNALQAYNVLNETRDASNNVCFTLNYDSLATHALLALL